MNKPRLPSGAPLDRLARLAGEGAAWFFVVIVAITAWEVVMRRLLGAPTIWVHELSTALAAAAFVAGGPAVHAARRHIVIGFFLERLPAEWQRRLGVVNGLLAIVFLALLTWAAGNQALVAMRDLETSGTALNWPVPLVLKTLFALASALMLLQSLGHLLRDLEQPPP
ncbi:MAG: TRAP transporter small permease subunit [Betaproteobacteria bacterium]